MPNPHCEAGPIRCNSCLSTLAKQIADSPAVEWNATKAHALESAYYLEYLTDTKPFLLRDIWGRADELQRQVIALCHANERTVAAIELRHAQFVAQEATIPRYDYGISPWSGPDAVTPIRQNVGVVEWDWHPAVRLAKSVGRFVKHVCGGVR